MRLLKSVNEAGVRKADIQQVLSSLDGMLLHDRDEEKEVSFSRVNRMKLGQAASHVGTFCVKCNDTGIYYTFFPTAGTEHPGQVVTDYFLYKTDREPVATSRIGNDGLKEFLRGRRIDAKGSISKLIDFIRRDVALDLEMDY